MAQAAKGVEKQRLRDGGQDTEDDADPKTRSFRWRRSECLRPCKLPRTGSRSPARRGSSKNRASRFM